MILRHCYSYSVYKASHGLGEGERWAILAALYDAHDEADEELARFRGESA